MERDEEQPLVRPPRSSRRLEVVPPSHRQSSHSPDVGASRGSNGSTPQPPASATATATATASSEIADVSDETQRGQSSSSTARAPSRADRPLSRAYHDALEDGEEENTSAMSSRRAHRLAALKDDAFAVPRHPASRGHEASGRRSVSSGNYFGSSSSARIAAALDNAERIRVARPASQMLDRSASRLSTNTEAYAAPAPTSARRTANRSLETFLDMDRTAGDTSFESDSSFQYQRNASAGGHGRSARARADLLLMKTPPIDERSRPISRTALSRASERYPLDAAMPSARYSSEHAARLSQRSQSATYSRQSHQPQSAEHSPLDSVRERRSAQNLSLQTSNLAPEDAQRTYSRGGRQRRGLGRDVFDDAPPLPSSSKHPLSPVYVPMELSGSRSASGAARQREASSGQGRTSVLDDVRARIDDLTGNRSFSRASSRFSRDPSYYSSTPSHSHATSSATSIHPSTEPRHKPRTTLSHAIQEDVADISRSSSHLRHEAPARHLMGRASAMAERAPVTPDTSHILTRRRSFYTTPASASLARPSSRPSLPSTGKDASTPLHSRNLLSSMDAFERHYLGLLDVEAAQKTMPLQADMVSKMQEATYLALDLNTELRAIVQQNLENQIDAEISNAETKHGTTYAEAFAQMDKSLGGLVRRSDEHVRRLTEGLMLMTRVDHGAAPAPISGMTSSRSADDVGASSMRRHLRASTAQGNYVASQRLEPRHTSLETRRSIQHLRVARDARYASSSQTPSEVSTSSASAGRRARLSPSAAFRAPGSGASPSDATRNSFLAPSPTLSSNTAATTTARNKARSATSVVSQRSSPQILATSPSAVSRRSTLSAHSTSKTASSSGQSAKSRQMPQEMPTQYHEKPITAVETSGGLEEKVEDQSETVGASPLSNLAAERPKEQSSINSLRTISAAQASPISPNKGRPVPASVSNVNVAQQVLHGGLEAPLGGDLNGLMLQTGPEEPEDKPQDDDTVLEYEIGSPRPSIDRSISIDSVDSLHSNRSGPPPSAWRGTMPRKQSTPPVGTSNLTNMQDAPLANGKSSLTIGTHDFSAPFTPGHGRKMSQSSVTPVTAHADTTSSLDLASPRRQSSDVTYDAGMRARRDRFALGSDWSGAGGVQASSSGHPQRSASVASVGLARSLGRHAGLSVRERIKALEGSSAAAAAAANEMAASPPTGLGPHAV